MDDWHNFGAHYDVTLVAWHQNFETNGVWREENGPVADSPVKRRYPRRISFDKVGMYYA